MTRLLPRTPEVLQARDKTVLHKGLKAPQGHSSQGSRALWSPSLAAGSSSPGHKERKEELAALPESDSEGPIAAQMLSFMEDTDFKAIRTCQREDEFLVLEDTALPSSPDTQAPCLLLQSEGWHRTLLDGARGDRLHGEHR